MSWVANLCPQVNAFTRMLWAAWPQDPSRNWVYSRQISLPLQWLHAFTVEQAGALQRTFVQRTTLSTVITFDGSPTGGGAFIQLAVPPAAARATHPVSYHWSAVWSAADERLLGAKIGDCASQARWEAYALLRAVRVWRPILQVSESQLTICGDALGVLHDARSFRARDPVLNRIMAELALHVAPLGFSIATVHVWSEHNATCDALSREHISADSLPCLAQSTRSAEGNRDWRYLSRCT